MSGQRPGQASLEVRVSSTIFTRRYSPVSKRGNGCGFVPDRYQAFPSLAGRAIWYTTYLCVCTFADGPVPLLDPR
jgi:hypothetical protein